MRYDIIRDELKSNNIEIDKETLSFHIDTCLDEYEEIYKRLSLHCIYEEINPNNFGPITVYLALAYRIN